MDDDELRAEFAALRTPAAPITVPPLLVIRKRLRRRRGTQATAGLLACACAAVSAVLIKDATVPRAVVPTPISAHDACTGRQLAIRWAAEIGPSSLFMEPPPVTYLLAFRNTGTSACSVTGWPEVRAIGSRLPAAVSVSNRTLSELYPSAGARDMKARIVEPTTVELSPGDTAVSAVTVALSPSGVNCVSAAWSAGPPGASGPERRLPGGPPEICQSSSIVVSPVYPAGVPLTSNYPPAVAAASPSATTNPAPPPAAGPAAAPYFVLTDRSAAPSPVIVRAWRTGRLIATIRPPAGSGARGFTGVAAAGDDATFVLAAGSVHTRFYQLKLVHGRPGSPIPLPVPLLAQPGEPFAVSADGGELAIAGTTGGGATITIVSLATGAHRTWTAPGGDVTTVAWAGSSMLAFIWAPGPVSAHGSMRAGLRVIDTGGTGSSLASSRLLVPASVAFGSLHGLINPLFSADGAQLFATMTRSGSAPQAAVVEFSGRTGRPLRAVTPRADESGHGTWCGAVWSDPSGARALAVCGVQGMVANGRFTPVDLHFPAPDESAGPNFFGW